MPDADQEKYGPILRTKLNRPRPTGHLISRPRLTDLMFGAAEKPLILVSAPTGYGKSVLAGQWAEQRDEPVAWLSLDADDSELRSFLAYLLAALARVATGGFPATSELVAQTTLPPVAVLADSLINELTALESSVAVVLDDYHQIEPISPVHDLVDRILEHAPTDFQLVLLCRRDPPLELTGLRASSKVQDVRLQDLRLTPSETSEFLDNTLQRTIRGEDLDNLESKIEGWAAGLRLVTLVLRHTSDQDAFLDGLPSSVVQSEELLLRELIAVQPAEVRECLLASSVTDRFCAELLQATCRPAEAEREPAWKAEPITSALLNEVRAGNLLAISLDSSGTWYRYHHAFRAALQSELQRVHSAEHVAALHARASTWLNSRV